MKLAPLQLTDYFVYSIEVKAIPSYDNSKPIDLDIDELKVDQKCYSRSENSTSEYVIELQIQQSVDEGKNLPYSFELHMVGFIDVIVDVPEDKKLRTVEVNGPSMLFGAAREIIRAATGRGPYGPVLIPSTTFYNPSENTRGASKKVAKKSSKKGNR